MIYTCRKSKQDENGKKKSKTFYFYEFFSLWVLPYAVVILYKICLFGYGYNFSTKDLKHLCSSVKLCVKTEKTKNKNKNNEALGMIWLWWFLGTICWMTTNLFLSLCYTLWIIHFVGTTYSFCLSHSWSWSSLWKEGKMLPFWWHIWKV